MMKAKIHRHPPLFEVRYVNKPGGCERPHTHSSLIVSAISDGHISLQINDDLIYLKKNEVAAVGPDMLHCVRSYSPDFQGVYVLEIFDLPTCNNSKFNRAHFQMFKSLLLKGSHPYNAFKDLCERLLSPLEEPQKTEALSEWAISLFDAHFSLRTGGISKHDDLADTIREILDCHDGESPPFEKISKICGLSKERCNRIFRRAYNISIQGYFLNGKAAHARALLSSDQTLSDIALECGFYDQSHFSRVFKEIFQISPAKYRALLGEGRQSHTRKS